MHQMQSYKGGLLKVTWEEATLQCHWYSSGLGWKKNRLPLPILPPDETCFKWCTYMSSSRKSLYKFKMCQTCQTW